MLADGKRFGDRKCPVELSITTTRRTGSIHNRIMKNRLTVGASGGAAVGVVAEGVDVHATLGVGVVTADVPCNGGGSGLGGLLEGDSSGNLGVTTDDSNCR